MKGRKGLLNALLIFFCAVFLISAFMLGRELLRRRQARQEFDELALLVTQTPQPTPAATPSPSGGAQEEPEVTPSAEPEHKRDIAALQALNSHCVGWLCIPDTNINYPVMHTPDAAQYYLRLNFRQEYSVAGTPFLDYRCTPESENLIIYGHNMTDGSMFADLLRYLDGEYLAAHPVIEFETTQGCVYYQVVDVRQVDPYDGWYSYGSRPGDTQYLTLSTCGETGSERVMVIARKME